MEKILASKLLKRNNTNRRIMTVDLHIGLVNENKKKREFCANYYFFLFLQAAAGLTADCRQLGNRARQEASNYRELFDQNISGKVSSNE